MAAAVTILDTSVQGNQLVKTVGVLGDNSYPTGGYSVTAAQMGFQRITSATASLAGSSAVNCTPVYNTVTQKLQFFWTGAVVSTQLAEVTNTTNLALTGANLVVQGF